MRRLIVALTLVAALALSAAFAQAGQDLPDQLLDLWDDDDYFAALAGAVQDATVTDQALEELAEHPDWRVRTQASIVLLWRNDADLFETIWKAPTYRGRRGRIVRFDEPAMELPQATPALIERLLRTDEPAAVQIALVKVLIRNGQADEHMLGLLGAVADAEVRLHVVHGFRSTSLDVATVGLSLALQDESPLVRAEAARSIGWRADGAVLATELLNTLEDAEDEPRAMAARALGWLAVDAAIEPLTALVADASPEVRLHALRSLDRIDSDNARRLPALDALTRDADPKVARVAKRIAGTR